MKIDNYNNLITNLKYPEYLKVPLVDIPLDDLYILAEYWYCIESPSKIKNNILWKEVLDTYNKYYKATEILKFKNDILTNNKNKRILVDNNRSVYYRSKKISNIRYPELLLFPLDAISDDSLDTIASFWNILNERYDGISSIRGIYLDTVKKYYDWFELIKYILYKKKYYKMYNNMNNSDWDSEIKNLINCYWEQKDNT